MSAGLISVIGPPAVGKTTLAERLSAELPAELIREDYRGNPFLADSYVAGEPYRLASQLHFVLSRLAQLRRTNLPKDALAITDYGFCQDPIFARLRLDDQQFRIYSGVLERLAPLVRRPDVVIHLDASEDTLLRRIAERGRAFEAVMTRRFICRMRDAYNAAAAQQACPVIAVDCEADDLLRPQVRRRLAARILELLS